MRTVQEVFNAVIERKLYPLDHNLAYMCLSIDEAVLQCVIAEEEGEEAKAAIQNYLDEMRPGTCSLYRALMYNNLRCDYEARREIYQNWEQRPRNKSEHFSRFVY